MMNCQLRTLPIKYLGMSLTNCHLTIEDFEFIMDRVGKRCEPWIGKHQSTWEKSTLINSCLSSLPMFIMGFFLLQDGVHAKFDYVWSRFVWEKDSGKQHTICALKVVGSLGIINTKLMNRCLMTKWACKILTRQRAWLDIICHIIFAERAPFVKASTVQGSQF